MSKARRSPKLIVAGTDAGPLRTQPQVRTWQSPPNPSVSPLRRPWTYGRSTSAPATRASAIAWRSPFAPMVKYIVYWKAREIPARCEVDDFISCGLEALIASIDRYDPEKGATLERYAWTRIHGAVLDELRRNDWAPRSLRDPRPGPAQAAYQARIPRAAVRRRCRGVAAHAAIPAASTSCAHRGPGPNRSGTSSLSAEPRPPDPTCAARQTAARPHGFARIASHSCIPWKSRRAPPGFARCAGLRHTRPRPALNG